VPEGRDRALCGFESQALLGDATHIMLGSPMLVPEGGAGGSELFQGWGEGTHCWKEAKSKHAQQTGLPAGAISYDDEFPGQPDMSMGLHWRAIGLKVGRRQDGASEGLREGVRRGWIGWTQSRGNRAACLPADDILGGAIICHGWQPDKRASVRPGACSRAQSQ